MIWILDILSRQIITFKKVLVAFGVKAQDPFVIVYAKIFRLKGLVPKTKGHWNS